MTSIRCFFLEPTGQTSVSLRRYTHNNTPDCCSAHPGKSSYHDTKSFIFNEPVEKDERGYNCNGLKPLPPHDDPRWPTQCKCGYVFQEHDEWQRFTEEVYRRVDTGEEMILSQAPAGAMWYAWWSDRFCTPQGEHNLMVKTPGGDWAIDSQASNCTMPDDRKQERHHCWIRHGTPPDITVSKEGGTTCGAGAGSIQCGSYHGFLRSGYLED